MNLQVIKSVDGKPEYVLLPIDTYYALKSKLDDLLNGEYEPFDISDYIDNPIALARMKANLTQVALADAMGVSQAYISQLESQSSVSPKMLSKVMKALEAKRP